MNYPQSPIDYAADPDVLGAKDDISYASYLRLFVKVHNISRLYPPSYTGRIRKHSQIDELLANYHVSSIHKVRTGAKVAEKVEIFTEFLSGSLSLPPHWYVNSGDIREMHNMGGTLAVKITSVDAFNPVRNDIIWISGADGYVEKLCICKRYANNTIYTSNVYLTSNSQTTKGISAASTCILSGNILETARKCYQGFIEYGVREL